MTREEKIAKLKEAGYSFGDASSPSNGSPSPTGIQKSTPTTLTREQKIEKLKSAGVKITAPEVNPKWYESAGAFAASTLKNAFLEVAKVGAIIPRLTGLDDGTAINEADVAGDRLLSKAFPQSDSAISAGKFAGTVTPYLFPVKAVQKGTSSIFESIAQGVKTGATSGAISGMASESGNIEADTGDILKSGALGGLIGGVTGGALTGTVGGISKLLSAGKAAVTPTPPTSKAVESLLDDIAPQDAKIISKAKSISQKALSTHNSVVKQYYDEAYKTSVPQEAVQALESNPTIKRAFEQLAKREDAVGDAYRALPRDSFARFDILKKHLNADYSKFSDKTKPDKYAASLTSDLIHDVTDQLDQISPAYQKARLLAGEDITGINALKASPLGKLANAKEGAFVDLSKKVFNSRLDPEDFKTMRDAYVKQDPEIWNGLTRRYIEDSMESLKNVGGEKNTPYRLYQAVLGNDKKIGMLSEAMNVPGPKNHINKLKLLTISRIFDDAFAAPGKGQRAVESLPVGAGEFVKSLAPTQAEKFNKKVLDFLTSSRYDTEFARIARSTKLSDADKINTFMKTLEPSYGVRLRGVTSGVSAGTGKAPSALTESTTTDLDSDN